jgi:hypothetical protein
VSLGFSERVGGILVAPVKTLRAVVAGPSGRGASDVALLIAARLVAGETPRLLRAVFRGIDLGVGAGVGALIAAMQTVLPDMVAILGAAFVLSLLAGSRKKGETQHADPLDLAAYAWVAYLAVQLVSALVFTLVGRAPPPIAQQAILVIALGWSIAVWAAALWILRDQRRGTA